MLEELDVEDSGGGSVPPPPLVVCCPARALLHCGDDHIDESSSSSDKGEEEIDRVKAPSIHTGGRRGCVFSGLRDVAERAHTVGRPQDRQETPEERAEEGGRCFFDTGGRGKPGGEGGNKTGKGEAAFAGQADRVQARLSQWLAAKKRTATRGLPI